MTFIGVAYRYRVCDSLHRHVSIGDDVKLVIEKSSVEGADEFYAQVGNPILTPIIQQFGMIEQAAEEYGQNAAAQNETVPYR